MTPRNEPRRPSLATIVGSSLAVAAAASLVAFGSLAEQAGLQGLAVGGLQPAQPGRGSGGGRAITVPAPPATPPEDSRDTLAELVRDTIERDRIASAPEPRPAITFTPAPRDRDRRDPIENRARVAVAEDELETSKTGGPPYGHAYGHYKHNHDHSAGSKPGKRKGASKGRDQAPPVYARSANDEAAEAPKAPKMKKAKPENGNGHSNGNGNGNAKGHAKHSNGNGKAKGKGHAKHGG